MYFNMGVCDASTKCKQDPTDTLSKGYCDLLSPSNIGNYLGQVQSCWVT